MWCGYCVRLTDHSAPCSYLTLPESDLSVPLNIVYNVFVSRVHAAGISGLPIVQLYDELSPLIPTLTVSLIQSMAEGLLNHHLIIQAGIDQLSYVSHSNSRVWLVHSLKDTKGRYHKSHMSWQRLNRG